jgi:hypothetical protein
MIRHSVGLVVAVLVRQGRTEWVQLGQRLLPAQVTITVEPVAQVTTVAAELVELAAPVGLRTVVQARLMSMAVVEAAVHTQITALVTQAVSVGCRAEVAVAQTTVALMALVEQELMVRFALLTPQLCLASPQIGQTLGGFQPSVASGADARTRLIITKAGSTAQSRKTMTLPGDTSGMSCHPLASFAIGV